MPMCEASALLIGVGLLLLFLACSVSSAPQVPCHFIFGDSLVDNGNNNNIASLARANYLPNGIDFPNGPTGRFCNGLTFIDVIYLCIHAANLLGFDDFIPPYARASRNQLLTGVNFASAAAGIRDETGRQLGARISFSEQVQNYQSAVQQIVNILGGDEDSAASYLGKCIFSVVMGSNDYLNNYFMPKYYLSSRQYTPEQYADVLIQQYSQQIQILYNYGARKVALIGVSQVGCIPNELAKFSKDGVTCIDRINNACDMFNRKLMQLVDQFNKMDGAHFTYINAYGIFQDILSNPAANGLVVTNRGCCGVGRNNGQITCLPLQTPCQNRNQYLFWDAFHPTQAANVIIGGRAYSAQSSSDVYPLDIHHLAQI